MDHLHRLPQEIEGVPGEFCEDCGKRNAELARQAKEIERLRDALDMAAPWVRRYGNDEELNQMQAAFAADEKGMGDG